MATFLSIFPFTTPNPVSATLATVTSTAEIVLGQNVKFKLTAGGTNGANAPLNVKFGVSGMSAADATGYFVPGGFVDIFDTGQLYDRIRVFNPGAGTVSYYVEILSNS